VKVTVAALSLGHLGLSVTNISLALTKILKASVNKWVSLIL